MQPSASRKYAPYDSEPWWANAVYIVGLLATMGGESGLLIAMNATPGDTIPTSLLIMMWLMLALPTFVAVLVVLAVAHLVRHVVPTQPSDGFLETCIASMRSPVPTIVFYLFSMATLFIAGMLFIRLVASLFVHLPAV